MKTAQLYQITYLPTNQVYYGSSWKEGKTYVDRVQEHLKGRGSKFIAELMKSGAKPEDFSAKLLLIGPLDYVCDVEMMLAKTNLYPIGLNGNAGKNIVRTAAGQKKVSDAVSLAKTGRTKENSEGVATQAKKLSAQRGANRTEKQKLWDSRKSETSKAAGIIPPILVKGSKKLTNGTRNIFVPPSKISDYLSNGWKLGSYKTIKQKNKEHENCKPD